MKTSKYKKQMYYKKYKIFPSKVCMITDCVLVQKWGTLERARKYVCKKL